MGKYNNREALFLLSPTMVPTFVTLVQEIEERDFLQIPLSSFVYRTSAVLYSLCLCQYRFAFCL